MWYYLQRCMHVISPLQWLNLLLWKVKLVQTELKRIWLVSTCFFKKKIYFILCPTFPDNDKLYVKLQQTYWTQPAPSITLPSAPFMTSGSCLQVWGCFEVLHLCWNITLGKPLSEVWVFIFLIFFIFYEMQTWIRALPDLFSITHSLLSWMPGTFLIIDGWIDSLAAASICLLWGCKESLIRNQSGQKKKKKIHINHTVNS